MKTYEIVKCLLLSAASEFDPAILVYDREQARQRVLSIEKNPKLVEKIASCVEGSDKKAFFYGVWDEGTKSWWINPRRYAPWQPW